MFYPYSDRKKKMEATNFLLVGLVLTICAVIFQLIGLASPYWLTTDLAGANVNLGLWKYCAESVPDGLTICVDTTIRVTEGILFSCIII